MRLYVLGPLVAAAWLLASCHGGPDETKARCTNGQRDGDESDVDCGGGCQPCADRLACARAADCASRACNSGQCGGPFCDDGLRNGDESDVDCGGARCLACGSGRACSSAADCVGGLCTAGRCLDSCGDGVRDGVETDVDCGGPVCQACGASRACLSDGDCLNRMCTSGQCWNLVTLQFATPPRIAAGSGCGTPRVGAVRGAFGIVDIAVVDDGGGASARVAVLAGHGNSRFDAPRWSDAGSFAQLHRLLALADFDGDGAVDALVAVGPDVSVTRLLRGRGDGSFLAPWEVPLLEGAAGPPAVADFDGDGRLDLASITIANGAGNVALARCTANGTFSPWVLQAGPGPEAADEVVAADFDGDHHADLAWSGLGLSLLLGQGDGTFAAARTLNYYNSRFLTVGDFDGDGTADLAFLANGSAFVMVRGVVSSSPALFAEPLAMATGDIDSDGYLDLTVLIGDGPVLLRGRGDGTFGPPTTLHRAPGCTGLAVADLDGDHRPDLVLTDDSGVQVLMNLSR